jgi:hypothetical protein
MRLFWVLAAAMLLLTTIPVVAEEAGAAAAKEGQRTARVAGGVTVAMVEPARSAAEWAAKRPRYEQLRPK